MHQVCPISPLVRNDTALAIQEGLSPPLLPRTGTWKESPGLMKW